MNIAINCQSFIRKKYTGIGRYAYHLVRTLEQIDPHNNYQLYVKKGYLNTSKRIPRTSAPNFSVAIDRFGAGVDKTISDIDIYHSPSPDLLNVNGGAKIIVTVHDLIFKTFPQGHTQKALDETEAKFKSIGERASKIICCSNNTIKDLQRYFNIPRRKISLVYQGVDKNLFYMIGQEEERIADKLLKQNGIKEPFILSVGTIEPRKNLENLLYAFDKLRARGRFDGKLVVIGMKGWLSDGIEGLIRKLELKNHVVFLGYLTDQELRCFYNKAEVFVFPSFYEGFGFPIVEAFCCGTPVVTSNVSSCPEVSGDAALNVNPYDPEAIADGISRVVHDKEYRLVLREKGFRRAGDFNFRKTATQTLDVYKEVYKL